MTGYRRYTLASVCAVLSIVMAAGSARAQLLTIDVPKKKVVDTVHILTTLVNSQTNTFSIPDDQDFILTDVVATCRTLNACALTIFGPFQNASFELVHFNVAAQSTVSHAFNTGIRVAGGGGGQLFIQNLIQPGPNALLSVTVTGYFVQK